MSAEPVERPVPRFDRGFFDSGETFARIGGGGLGGKAGGLIFIRDTLERAFQEAEFPDYEVRIPKTVVLATDVYDAFVQRNNLHDLVSEDDDRRIAQAFQSADLPTEIVGDLRSLVDHFRTPLAVRSSSLLEDALYRPFAGIYETKMTPNNQPGADGRFRRLVEAIKVVYASTFFQAARTFATVAGHDIGDEKMAVIIQEVVGSQRWDRFYPTLAAVGRTYNFYASEGARPEEGVMSLALGLGKTIVDGGACWTYSPAFPNAPAPYGSNRDLLRYSQNRFWAVNMGKPPAFDPASETEYMLQGNLEDAELDGSLSMVASTYDPQSDRLIMGTGGSGARVIDFAPLLRRSDVQFNALVQHLMATCREALGQDVEIELALDEDRKRERSLLGFLQIRPMVVEADAVSISDEDLESDDLILASRRAVGNAEVKVADVVYVRRGSFRPETTVATAAEVGEINARLSADGRPYLLLGFGRWGTSDHWGGIPVAWNQISGARVIVEALLPPLRAESSQGSHFFHNVTSLRVLYLGLNQRESDSIDWDWLDAQPTVTETAHVRHVRLSMPLTVRVDGRRRIGGAWKDTDGTEG